MISEISVVIIARNAERSIQKCLESIRSFGEVILYVNDTTDRTKEIASSFSSVRIIDGEFDGFGLTRNRAAECASKDWILVLDTDEVVSPELLNSIAEEKLDENRVYLLSRRNYYRNHEIRHCWGDDLITRLYSRKRARFCDRKVHEHVISEGLERITLKGFLMHYPYQNLSEFLDKANSYSSIYAADHAGKASSSPSRALANALFSFTKTFVFKRGFMDGYPGLVIAFSHAVTNFFKYMKLYEAGLRRG